MCRQAIIKSRRNGLEDSVLTRFFLADGEEAPLESSGRPLFFEAIHMEALRVFGRANLNHYFFSTAHVSNLIPLRTA